MANEDHNIYIFDKRNMACALNVLRDHVHAVIDVEFRPTGEELVSTLYDRSIRLRRRNQAARREGVHSVRERQKLEYDAALVEYFRHMPEIQRIRRACRCRTGPE